MNSSSSSPSRVVIPVRRKKKIKRRKSRRDSVVRRNQTDSSSSSTESPLSSSSSSNHKRRRNPPRTALNKRRRGRPSLKEKLKEKPKKLPKRKRRAVRITRPKRSVRMRKSATKKDSPEKPEKPAKEPPKKKRCVRVVMSRKRKSYPHRNSKSTKKNPPKRVKLSNRPETPENHENTKQNENDHFKWLKTFSAPHSLQPQSPTSLANLPNPILTSVIFLLDKSQDVLNVALTCRYLASVALAEDTWREFFSRAWGTSATVRFNGSSWQRYKQRYTYAYDRTANPTLAPAPPENAKPSAADGIVPPPKSRSGVIERIISVNEEITRDKPVKEGPYYFVKIKGLAEGKWVKERDLFSDADTTVVASASPIKTKPPKQSKRKSEKPPPQSPADTTLCKILESSDSENATPAYRISQECYPSTPADKARRQEDFSIILQRPYQPIILFQL